MLFFIFSLDFFIECCNIFLDIFLLKKVKTMDSLPDEDERIIRAQISLEGTKNIIKKEIAEELCGLVPLNDYMIMGFIKRGIINWQIKTNTPILAFTKMDPHKKLQVISDILKFASSHMVRGIYSSDMLWKEQMKHKIFHSALETYEEVISAQFLLDTNQEFSELDTEKTNWK